MRHRVKLYQYPSTHRLHRSTGFLPICPQCGKPHGHGYASGWRTPHCTTIGGFDKRDYYLKASGPIPEEYRLLYVASDFSYGDSAVTKKMRKAAKATIERQSLIANPRE